MSEFARGGFIEPADDDAPLFQRLDCAVIRREDVIAYASEMLRLISNGGELR